MPVRWIRHPRPILHAWGIRPSRQSWTTVFTGSWSHSAACFGVRKSGCRSMQSPLTPLFGTDLVEARQVLAMPDCQRAPPPVAGQKGPATPAGLTAPVQ